MPSLSDVTVIVPQYHQCHLTRRCVDSLIRAHGETPPEILVADDGSAPVVLAPEVAWFEARSRFLRLEHRGVTATWNAAARACITEWLVFLNNDTGSLGPWVDRLLEPLRAGRSQLSGVSWRTERHLPKAWRSLPSEPRLLTGWCLGISRDKWLALGGFDESLELYFSDTDLQLRLLKESPCETPLVCVEDLPLIHAGHATAHRLPDQRRQWHRDWQRFQEKWGGPVGEGDGLRRTRSS